MLSLGVLFSPLSIAQNQSTVDAERPVVRLSSGRTHLIYDGTRVNTIGTATICNGHERNIIWAYAFLEKNVNPNLKLGFREDIFSRSCITLSGLRLEIEIPSAIDGFVNISYSIEG